MLNNIFLFVLINDYIYLILISDFGLSKQLNFDICQNTDVGTVPYKPPDVLLGNPYYSYSFDVWSIGCVLVELATGHVLFPEDNNLEALKLMLKIFGNFLVNDLPFAKIFVEKNKNIFCNTNLEQKFVGLVNHVKNFTLVNFENDDFYDLIEKMLNVNPVERIDLQDCLRHPWFRKM